MTDNPHHVPGLFYIFAFISMFYLAYNLRRLFTVNLGRPEDYRPLSFLEQISNSLSFGVGQKKVYSKRFTYASIMHFLIGWGFLELLFATTVDFFTARGWFVEYLPGFDTPWFAFANDTGGIMLTVGCIMALFRRHYNKPVQLPQNKFGGRNNLFGDSGILIALIVLCIGGFLAESARLAIQKPETAHYSWVGYSISKLASDQFWTDLHDKLWWSHAIASLLFISLLPMTKMFHVIAVIANVALTNRKKHGILRPMHVAKMMEDPEADIENMSLGASKVKDFTWKQLLDSVSCTECARCTTVCPATNTGKPLSPMKIITDIRGQLYAETMGMGKTDNLVSGLITETELWSCTTCGACMEECPVLIEHIPTITDMRRHLVLSEGKPPAQANESLEKTMNNGNPWGFQQNDRTKWAEDVDISLPTLADKKEVDILYWVGCAGSYDPRNQKIATDLIKILEHSGINYAVLGKEETCTGDSARRLGEEYLFETLAKKNIDTMNQYKFDRVVASCPHCLHTISKEYPDFGGNYEVIHHTELIEELMQNGSLHVNNVIDDKITYHDACYLGRHNDIYETPRNVIKNIMNDDAEYVEMKESKASSMCCGAGGGNMWHEIDEGSRINVTRFEQAIETGAETVATACSFCAIMMDDAMKIKGQEQNMQVLDVAELVAKGID